MKGRILLINCPNCGGVLTKDGDCPYCNSHVRFANEIDLQFGGMFDNNYVDIQLNVRNETLHGDEILVIPIRGRIYEITTSQQPLAAIYAGDREVMTIPGQTEIEFTFCGHVIDERRKNE